ncbi:hypothetical protein TWF694_008636 [Orbilia ellipsospora]|uniref:Uncharacterized protein n=1 Tax=Orbilia ellipsospora TaxID=2528407 RepID=A0AAV9XHL8_9PEZI
MNCSADRLMVVVDHYKLHHMLERKSLNNLSLSSIFITWLLSITHDCLFQFPITWETHELRYLFKAAILDR